MEMIDIEKEVMELRERVSRAETSQNAVEKLAQSVQEIALSLKELTIQTQSNTKKLEDMDSDTRKKQFYIWSVVIGGVFGAAISYIISAIL